MKKTVIFSLALASAVALHAQDAYDAATLASENLNGTARYVGMGGALDALGADLSTISTNPAAIGLFRHSKVQFSMSLVSQENAKKYGGVGKNNVSFDQAGFVWSNQTDVQSFVNFAFNYHKSNNFNQIIAAANAFAPSTRREDASGAMTELVGSGQNLQTLVKGQRGLLNSDKKDIDGINYYQSQVDYMYSNLLMFDQGGTNVYYPVTASSFDFRQGRTGYIGVYDFNLSGNSNDRIYWGLSVGIHDVHYEAYTSYNEALESGHVLPNASVPTSAGLTDERSIKGQGVDIKAGLIVRPIAESPFRIGVSVTTPTWYKLTTSNFTTAYVDIDDHSQETYDFKYYTPWRFGLSLGHTVGSSLALGAGYEFTDFSSCDMRYITGTGYNGDESRSDADMNDEIGYSLKGVHTLKVGAEFRPDPAVAVRLGYNFVSPKYGDNDVAYRNQKTYSSGVYYASTTDYTNWKATHRITAGIGTKIDKFSVDLAYQYSVTKGDFFPFADGEYYEGNGMYIENVTPVTKVDFKRHQVLLTLGYTF